MKRNYRGEVIDGPRKLLRPEFRTGIYFENGEPEIEWKNLSEYADEDGFDTRNVEDNGYYKIFINLTAGTKIIRYGNETGTFTAPEGTPYESLALPYIKESVEYNEYVVIADNLTVECKVQKGKVAPGFESKGGGIQYKHPVTIRESLKRRQLERIRL